MIHQILALRHADRARLDPWLAALDPPWVERQGAVACCTWGGPLVATVGGGAAGGLLGVLFNDRDIHARQSLRGHKLDLAAHDALCAAQVGAFGPRGLSELRFQGVLGVLHRGQRTLLMARDALGVAPLWWVGLGDGDAVGSDRAQLAALAGLEGVTAPPVALPAGLAAMMGERAMTCQALSPAPDTAPFARQAPTLAEGGGDPHAAGAGLWRLVQQAQAAWSRRLAGAGETAPQPGRGRGPVEAPTERDAAHVGAAGSLSRLGADDLWETLPWPDPWRNMDMGARIDGLQGLWRLRAQAVGHPRLQPPEPVARLQPERAARRWLRHVVTLPDVVGPAWEAAAGAGCPVVFAHFDPAVVAAVGALPHAALEAVAAERFKAETTPWPDPA